MGRSLSSITVLIALVSLLGVKATDAQTPSGSMKPTMTAKLIDPDKKAAEGGATIEVTVSGVELTDPAMANEKPVAGQAHLHYQVDKGPVVATTAAKLSFHELTPGSHTIVVTLVGNDHKTLGSQQQLTVNVPKGMKSTAGESKPTEAAPVKPAEAAPTTKPKY
jgi:hypothetical protein